MKSFLIIGLASLISFSAFAQDYACKPAYEKEISKLEKRHKKINRNFNRGMIAGTLTESLLFNTTIYAGSLTVYTPVMIGFFVAGVGWMFYEADKIEAHLSAKSIIEESFTGKEEIEQRQEEAYLSLQQYRAERAVKKINKKNRKAGLPEITVAEYLIQNPIPAFNKASVKTPLTSLSAKLKVSYEEASSAVRSLSQDETFCPGGNAMGKRQMRKVVQAKLIK